MANADVNNWIIQEKTKTNMVAVIKKSVRETDVVGKPSEVFEALTKESERLERTLFWPSSTTSFGRNLTEIRRELEREGITVITMTYSILRRILDATERANCEQKYKLTDRITILTTDPEKYLGAGYLTD